MIKRKVFDKNKEEFAKEIYQAKLYSNKSHLPSIEIFCDLLIAYSYINIESYEKATSILYKIIKSIKEGKISEDIINKAVMRNAVFYADIVFQIC